MVKKIMTYLLTGILLSTSSFSQPSPTKVFMPNLTPVSPEATSLGLFGTYKVNLFTGLPDISIPVFEIRVGELNVPVSINYHASGIMVDEMASWAGLGWSLQTGGSVTRKVVGMEDEGPGHYLSANSTSSNRVRLTTEVNTSTADGLSYLSNIYLKSYDVQPDIFTYNFPGHSGNFLFNQRNNFQPVLIPFEPIQINRTYSPSNLDFNIIDEKGNEYQFGAKEATNFQYPSGQDIYIPSAWMLTKMTSANKQDVIDFKFTAPSDFRDINRYVSDYVTVSDNVVNYVGNTYSSDLGTSYYNNGHSSSAQQILSEIDFKNGKIVFEAAPEARQDLGSLFNLQKRLQYIKVYSYDAGTSNFNLIKVVELFHSYFMFNSNTATMRLRLDSIQVRGTNQTAQTYGFEYNNSINMPDHYSTSKDYWGYFNNEINTLPNGTATTVPRMQIPYAGSTIWIGGSNVNARNPNISYNQACILQKIKYPTGGYSLFEYETNQYKEDPNPPAYAGGLRIKKISSYTDAAASAVVKTYKYGANESGYGRKNFFPDHSFFSTGQSYKFYIEPGSPGNENGISPLLAAGKTQSVYFANPTTDMLPFDGAAVVYPEVTEYTGDETNNTGKTVYQFNDKPDAKTTSSYPASPVFDTYHFVRGLLTNKSVYRKNTVTLDYTKIAETQNTYMQFPFESTSEPVGFALFKHDIYQNNFGEVIGSTPPPTAYVETNSYQFATYTIISSDNKLISNTELQYDEKNTGAYNSVTTNYTYDDKQHLQLSQTSTTNSKNETITSTYTHPYNYTTVPYPSMTTSHIFDPVVQETMNNSVSGQLFQKTNNYSSFTGTNYLPANIQLKIKSNPVETRASFNQYDLRGNILEMQKSLDTKQSFIWDYQGISPIAEVTNAVNADIAYTSFEADGTGNWTFTPVPSSPDPTAPTGNRYYTLGASITKSGLNAAGTYIVSYWKKSGTVAVNATTPTSGFSINGWTYYEHKIINPAGGLITVSGTNGVIDELRLYPATALMKTYAYAPLIGITSSCDANNRLTYFEYDNFNRLILVRDQNRNILKKICYNYAGQVENCNTFYNSVQSGSITKNNCTSCLVGATVTYTVPAKTYSGSSQSEADLLAINDVVANRQAYANSVGTCTVPSAAAVTGSNQLTQGYTITLHNNCTATNYSFTMPSGSVTNVSLGSVPAGNYNVTFSAGSVIATFRINGTMTLRAMGGTISNVNLSASGNTIAITP